ncbi:MFS general substrate transporter [Panus rudis PR-1116 ss-1]|nr:MFS general substrate transporter [Panus rudis PR-1116 ss-1]
MSASLSSETVQPENKPPPTEPEIVVFSQSDPDDPRHWQKAKKRGAPGEGQLREMYGVNADVASTGLTLYVLGFAIGPLVWPCSEMYGRRIPYMLSWVLMILTIVPSAFVENIVVILVFRLFTGICAACALNNLYPNDLRALSRGLGSLFGFFMAAHSGRGFWVLRIHWLFCIACMPLVFLFPETYGPTILSKRAARLRKEGKNAYAAHEVHGKSTMQVLQGHILRPLAMCVREPIVLGAAAWISLGYGIMYFFFEAYPVVFIEQATSFPLPIVFLGITFGMVLAVVLYPYLVRKCATIPLPGIQRGELDPLEANLKFVLTACLLLPISMFWFAWTSGPETHWLAPASAGIPFGYSSIILFFGFLSYTSHTYSVYSSSANAANTFVRSLVCSAFPVFSHAVMDNLGTKWGVSLFGFLSLALIPVPLVFIRYGAALRARSHFARAAKEVASRMRQSSIADDMEEPQDESERVVCDDMVKSRTSVEKGELGGRAQAVEVG